MDYLEAAKMFKEKINSLDNDREKELTCLSAIVGALLAISQELHDLNDAMANEQGVKKGIYVK